MEELINIVDEVREEFHIPPYISDIVMLRKAKECFHVLKNLNPPADLETDLDFRRLLKNFIYYSYTGISDQFMKNYQEDILTWQMYTPLKGETIE